MGGKGGGRIGRCGLHAHKQGGEADKGGCRGAGIGAPGARHVGEHVVVRALEGDAPLFVVHSLLVNWESQDDIQSPRPPQFACKLGKQDDMQSPKPPQFAWKLGKSG